MASTPGVGIQITSPTGTGPQGGQEQVIFTTKYPFTKIDSQNPVSFQNISIFFNSDPPASNGTDVKTKVYSFAHGYDYIPAYWVLFQDNNASATSTDWSYGNEGSVIKSPNVFSVATLLVDVDKTNFNVYVNKFWDNTFGDPQPNIIGYTIKLRVFIFTEVILQ